MKFSTKTIIKSEWAIILVGVIVVLIWLFFGWIYLMDVPLSQAGKFGDKFGAVNALFSGLAFTALFYTILLQRRQIKEQGEALRKTQVLALGQASALKTQQFESAFYSLLGYVVERGQTFRADGKSGPEALNMVDYTIWDILKDHKDSESLSDKIKKIYEELPVLVWKPDLNLFMGLIVEVIRYVMSNEASKNWRHRYHVLAGSLTLPQIRQFYYWAASSARSEESRKEIIRSRFFSVLPKDILRYDSHYDCFPPEAYHLNPKDDDSNHP